MYNQVPFLSVCLNCRDGREGDRHIRGGARSTQRGVARPKNRPRAQVRIRGVQCMSQCTRLCIVSLSSYERCAYMFGDLNLQEDTHVEALVEPVALYRAAKERIVERKDRPGPLRARILGRLPPLDRQSPLISNIERDDP